MPTTELVRFLSIHCSSLCMDDPDDRKRLAELLIGYGVFTPPADQIYAAVLASLETVLITHQKRGDVTLAQMACLPVLRKFLDEMARAAAQTIIGVLSDPDT